MNVCNSLLHLENYLNYKYFFKFCISRKGLNSLITFLLYSHKSSEQIVQ